ncbi:hypothetical protein O181_059781 [Austropuccinia psidii MF-1]|uniref:Uncharacterized protein n=1 Tax=Austropuccinia psidii MF-1 TaxID=1389203 RepID=A0A9Q3ECV0_9BASI|nr:hypothetical protein [Austropuccinia psidii MF-1]
MPTLTLELASTSPPNPLQHLSCLCARTPLQMRLQHGPPISALTTPYASAPLPHLLLGLQSLHCFGAPNVALTPPYASSHLPNTSSSYHPYAHIVLA